jgi:hypothetical protein
MYSIRPPSLGARTANIGSCYYLIFAQLLGQGAGGAGAGPVSRSTVAAAGTVAIPGAPSQSAAMEAQGIIAGLTRQQRQDILKKDS